MTLTNDLIFREELRLRTAGEIEGTRLYNSPYLVVEILGGVGKSIPYPGVILSQSFSNTDPEIRGSELILRRGKQLITVLGAGEYFLRFRSDTAIAKTTIKVWEYLGFFEGGGGNGGTLPPETIRNLLLRLEGEERLDYSILKNTPTIADIRDGLSELEGEERLDYGSLKNTPPPNVTRKIQVIAAIPPQITETLPIALPSAGILRQIQSNAPARIRCYLNQSYANADINRASNVQILGDHGCFWDLQTKAERGLIRNTAPPPVFYSDGGAYLTLSNLSNDAQSLTIDLSITEILK